MQNPLGQVVSYKDTLDPSLLFPISRVESRRKLGIAQELPFNGTDVWCAYELSWLDSQGIPKVAIARIEYAADSESIVESKSLKLFLGSYNNHRFGTPAEVGDFIQSELSSRIGSRCTVEVVLPEEWSSLVIATPPGISIDAVVPSPEGVQLSSVAQKGAEVIYSHLLRSLCPVTSQPDWGTVVIAYEGDLLDHGSLIRYLIDHRATQGFHEECCERLFIEVQRACKPSKLCVACFYTRRGGIDINPIRWLKGTTPTVDYRRLARQ
jgi:7-cyano-7-deazaguanine reductase